MTRQQIPRWSVALVATLGLATVGLIYANATVLAGTLVPLSYLLYEAVSGVPDGTSVAVTREISQEASAPGTAVDVHLTVENTGESVLPDLRLIDGVPEALAVEEGTPRLCASLSPGESETISYSVVTRRGSYTFESPVVRLRSLAASERVTTTVEAEGDDELVCLSTFQTDLHQTQTTPYTGVVTTDSGGSGLEFHSTRQYRQGDPVNRIDWHHLAKTGEFITVQYREQKRNRTVILLDARTVNRVTPRPGQPTTVERAVYAGERLASMLSSAGVETTVGAVGLDENTPDEDVRNLLDPEGLAWAGPGRETVSQEVVFDAVSRVATQDSGPGQQTLVPPHIGEVDEWGPQDDASDVTATQTPDEDPSASGGVARADGGKRLVHLLDRIPSDAQVVLCSPLLDNWPVAVCRRLGDDHDPVVVSPAPTGQETTGQRIAAAQRTLRLRELQRLAVSTVDWPLGEPFEIALQNALPALATHQ
jgi:uncharacterized protein (DUF58 family)